MEVGAAFVRIRPYVAERDASALAALDRLTHEIADAFDRFHEAVASDPLATLSLVEHSDSKGAAP